MFNHVNTVLMFRCIFSHLHFVHFKLFFYTESTDYEASAATFQGEVCVWNGFLLHEILSTMSQTWWIVVQRRGNIKWLGLPRRVQKTAPFHIWKEPLLEQRGFTPSAGWGMGRTDGKASSFQELQLYLWKGKKVSSFIRSPLLSHK